MRRGLAAALAFCSGTALAAEKPTTVLFMCPHGAAKSVLASAYFQRLAKERGLNVRVDSGGTEPDAAVAPKVAEHLKSTGYDVPIAKPRAVTAKEVAAADVVISIGCDLKGLPARLKRSLERAARRGRRSKSQIVRELLEQGLRGRDDVDPAEEARRRLNPAQAAFIDALEALL